MEYLTKGLKNSPFKGRPKAALKYLNRAKANPERVRADAIKFITESGDYKDETDKQRQIEDFVKNVTMGEQDLYGLDAGGAPPPGDVAPPGAGDVAPGPGLTPPGEPVPITTAAQYNKLPSGTRYRDPKGNIRVKR
ncbi:MAG TPA: hypothetical protein ENG75_03385 [Nitrospirae bacterium]|nr:hypothetical protein [Nitrospirota bacterium]